MSNAPKFDPLKIPHIALTCHGNVVTCKPLSLIRNAQVKTSPTAGLSVYEALLSVEGRVAGKGKGRGKGAKTKVCATAERSAMLFTHRGEQLTAPGSSRPQMERKS